MLGWRAAMAAALYGPDGFFVRHGGGPADHFRTSVHASSVFAGALLRLVERVDAALDHPEHFDLVDVGAGRGELLTSLAALGLPARFRLTAVELAPRPAGLDARISWRRELPGSITGMLVATEWLDNVPLDVAEFDEAGSLRKVLVDPATGEETLGAPVDAADAFWASRWWPASGRTENEPPNAGHAGNGHHPSGRVEIGWPRDVAWADAVGRIRRGCALAVDYGHVRAQRPPYGTMTGFRQGRQVAPVPDGSCDVTAHVAVDSAAAAAGTAYRIMSQRTALRALGVDGARPPLSLAGTDPAAYLRALAGAGAAAELTDPSGLGGHWWLLHTVGLGERGSMLW